MLSGTNGKKRNSGPRESHHLKKKKEKEKQKEMVEEGSSSRGHICFCLDQQTFTWHHIIGKLDSVDPHTRDLR